MKIACIPESQLAPRQALAVMTKLMFQNPVGSSIALINVELGTYSS